MTFTFRVHFECQLAAWHTPVCRRLLLLMLLVLPGLRVQENLNLALGTAAQQRNWRYGVYCLSVSGLAWLGPCVLSCEGELISSDMLWPFCNDFCYDLCMLHHCALLCSSAVSFKYPVESLKWEHVCLVQNLLTIVLFQINNKKSNEINNDLNNARNNERSDERNNKHSHVLSIN